MRIWAKADDSHSSFESLNTAHNFIAFEIVLDLCTGRNQAKRTNAALEPNIYLRLLAKNVKKETRHVGPGCWLFDDVIKLQIAR